MDETRAVRPVDPRRRRFTLIDAMVLVAATTVALAACRGVMAAYRSFHTPPRPVTPGDLVRDMQERGVLFAPFHVLYWSELAAPFLVAWATALALLRHVPPRPPRGRRRRHPGSVAVAVAAGSLGCGLVGYGLLASAWPLGWTLVSESFLGLLYPPAFRCFMIAMTAGGFAIAGSWLALAGECRRRRRSARPDWIDRAGLALAVAWLAQTPLYLWASLISR